MDLARQFGERQPEAADEEPTSASDWWKKWKQKFFEAVGQVQGKARDPKAFASLEAYTEALAKATWKVCDAMARDSYHNAQRVARRRK